MIEQIGKIDIETVADRNDGGKSDAAPGGPLHQSGRNSTGLRNQRQIARRRSRGGKTGIEFDPGDQHAETIRAHQAHARGAGVFLADFGKRTGAMTKPRGDDDADCRPFARRGSHCLRYGSGRHRDGDNVGRLRQHVIGFDRANARDLIVARIDEVNCAGKPAAEKIFEHGAAGRCLARRSANDSDGSRGEKRFETIGGH